MLLTDVEQGEEVEAASEYRKNPQSENHLETHDKKKINDFPNVNQSSNYLQQSRAVQEYLQYNRISGKWINQQNNELET